MTLGTRDLFLYRARIDGLPDVLASIVLSYIEPPIKRDVILRNRELCLRELPGPSHVVRLSFDGSPCTSCYFNEFVGNDGSCSQIHGLGFGWMSWFDYFIYQNKLYDDLMRMSYGSRNVYCICRNLARCGAYVYGLAFRKRYRRDIIVCMHSKFLLHLELCSDRGVWHA